MADGETVITHLQIIHTWSEFARERDLQFFTAKHLEDIAQWSDDALNLLKEQAGIIDSLKSDLSETLDVVTNRKNIVRCKDCWRKGNPYLCRFDRDLEEHGSRRTEADDDWFCADGEKNDE